jgi:hypothetical protein
VNVADPNGMNSSVTDAPAGIRVLGFGVPMAERFNAAVNRRRLTLQSNQFSCRHIESGKSVAVLRLGNLLSNSRHNR